MITKGFFVGMCTALLAFTLIVADCDPDGGNTFVPVTVPPEPEKWSLDASLREYMVPQKQQWGDDDNRFEVDVYYLDHSRFNEFKAELDAGGEYQQIDSGTYYRDWERDRAFARLAVRPYGGFELLLCKSDNTLYGYRYYKVGGFIPVESIWGDNPAVVEVGGTVCA